MTLRVVGVRLLGGLLLFALLAAGAAPLGWDLPEPRSRASKIRVHPRGNLWATGESSGFRQPLPAPLTFLLWPLLNMDTSVQASGDPGTHLVRWGNLRPRPSDLV